MKPTTASVLKHKQVQVPSYRFNMRCEGLNIMNMRGYES